MQKFLAPWGWSKLDEWRKCKKQFAFHYIDKLPQPGNDAMKRGSDMHETIEAYLRGWISELPAHIYDWKDRLDELRTKNFTSEQAIGLDKNWLPLPDWFNKATWLRAKMDAKVLEGEQLTVIAFKSGKYREPSEDQVELYAIVGHALHPEIKSVLAQFWFIDQDEMYERLYQAAELLELRKKYEKEAQRIYDTEVWSESPSRECRWCTYSKSKAGPCKF